MSFALATRPAVQPEADRNRFMPTSDLNEEYARQYFLKRARTEPFKFWANNHDAAIKKMVEEMGLPKNFTSKEFAMKRGIMLYCETDQECVYPPPEKSH